MHASKHVVLHSISRNDCNQTAVSSTSSLLLSDANDLQDMIISNCVFRINIKMLTLVQLTLNSNSAVKKKL